VTLNDYDFEKPSVDATVKSKLMDGTHSHRKLEYYDLPGHHRSDQEVGNTFARNRNEAESARYEVFRGAGNTRKMGTGFTFKLKEHPKIEHNMEYLVTEAVHYLQAGIEMPNLEIWRALEPKGISFPDEVMDDYSYVIEAIPKSVQFRTPFVTPWPQVPGLQTGVVVGPQGKEIHTDEHGRVKVHFRWDRVNDKNDKASCWIRVATPWSGNNWGLNYVPRIGQEVIIQFEDGDPDRPIVTGMLYHKEKMPPYIDEKQPTRTGLMSRSSPGGGGDDYNALLFEDKKEAEFLHVQAQKDYQMIVKDSAQVTIGDKDLTVDKANQKAKEKSLHQTVQMHVVEEILEGDKEETIHKGKSDLTVEGNLTEVVKSGNMSLDVKTGEILLKAAKKIRLEVGGSSMEITPTEVKIEASVSVKVNGGTMVKVNGGSMTDVSGGAMLKLQGGLVKIN
jgi:type VI secretion system secreted protein VgrG